MKWQDIEGWFEDDDYQAFASLKDRVPASPTIVECGTYKGRSTHALAEIWPKAYIITCDPNETPQNLPRQAEFYPVQGKNLAYPGKIDILFIDDSHYYDDIKANFERFLPQLHDRGFVVFHDYFFETDAVADVRRFVDELGGCELYKGKYGGAIWQKKEK